MGSEQPSRAWFAGETACIRCGKKLTLKNFGHVRTRYPTLRREVVCLECVETQVKEHIYGTRQRLGFDAAS